MKIGLVRRGYSASGGAESYLRRFADAARAAGHDTVLFHGTDWPANAWTGEKVQIAKSDNPRAFADALQKLAPRKHCDFLLSLERVWECDAYRAGDGVHASWLQRRRAFEPFWKGWFRGFQKKHREILELENALFRGGAKCIIANSKMVQKEIVRFFRTPADRIHVVYNGLPRSPDGPAKSAAEIRREHGLRETDFVMLFVGSGWLRKGLKDAVLAVNALTDRAVLLVAGKGNAKELPSLARVRMVGTQSQAQLQELFAIATVFVLPTHYEPFSNACLEALAAGVPVITTTANGFSEIIEPGIGGDIVAPGDHAGLATTLQKWLQKPPTADARKQLREYASQFSIEENFAHTFEVISKLPKS